MLTREADVTEVVIDRLASPHSIGLFDENESVLAGMDRHVNGVAETKTLGNDHAGMGYSEPNLYAILNDVSDVGDSLRPIKPSAKPAKPTGPLGR